MTKQDVKEFMEIMTGVADNYNKKLSAAGLKMRYEALKDYSIDQVSQAATILLKAHRFNSMPTVGDFVSTINRAGGEIPVEDKAEVEAGKVLEHLRRYGAGTTPKFLDPITKQLMNGRWRYGAWARHVLESELKWWRKEFIQAYKAHHTAGAVAFLPAGKKLQQITHGITMVMPSSRREAANVR